MPFNVRAYQRQWTKENKEHLAEYRRGWEDENREKRSEYFRDRYQKLREDAAILARRKVTLEDWKRKNAERLKAFRRLRTLRDKEERGTLSDGEAQQMLELAAKFPRRRTH